MLVIILNHDFAQIEVAVDKASIMCSVHSSCHLNGDIEDQFTVLASDIKRQIYIQRSNIVEHVASIMQLRHLKPIASIKVFEALEGSDYITVRIHIDPLVNTLILYDLFDHEFLAEVLVINNETSLCHNMFNL